MVGSLAVARRGTATHALNWDGFKKMWLRWCELTGHPVLIPFDMTLFCEW
jgi:hypothetical protein